MLKFSLVFSILALGACTEEPTVHSSTSPVTCSGSCDFDASAGDRDVGVFATVTGGTVAWSGGAWFIPIVEPAGTSLTSVSMTVVDLTGNPVIARFTVNGQIVGSAQSSGTGATQTLVVPIGRIVASGDVNALVLIPTDTNDTRKETASTGHVTVTILPTSTVRSISALEARPCCTPAGATFTAGMWSFTSPLYTYFPVRVALGETIDGFNLFASKLSGASTGIVVDLVENDSATGAQNSIASTSNFTNAPGLIVVGRSLSHAVVTNKTYMLRVAESATGGNVSAFDTFTDAQILVH